MDTRMWCIVMYPGHSLFTAIIGWGRLMLIHAQWSRFVMQNMADVRLMFSLYLWFQVHRPLKSQLQWWWYSLLNWYLRGEQINTQRREVSSKSSGSPHSCTGKAALGAGPPHHFSVVLYNGLQFCYTIFNLFTQGNFIAVVALVHAQIKNTNI